MSDLCTICHRPHITDEEIEQRRRACNGTLTSALVARVQSDYDHYKHDLRMKNQPPEYVI